MGQGVALRRRPVGEDEEVASVVSTLEEDKRSSDKRNNG